MISKHILLISQSFVYEQLNIKLSYFKQFSISTQLFVYTQLKVKTVLLLENKYAQYKNLLNSKNLLGFTPSRP